MEATAAMAIAARLFVLDSTFMIFFNWGLNFLSYCQHLEYDSIGNILRRLPGKDIGYGVCSVGRRRATPKVHHLVITTTIIAINIVES